MASTPQRGPGMGLPLAPMSGNNGVRSLPAGEFHQIPPGQWYVTPGPYCFLEWLDPISGVWRGQNAFVGGPHYLTSDGQNVRVANRTGTALGAYVTNVGSAYTSAPAVTASAGGSTWLAIVGGAINATVTITTAGVGYNYVPDLIISAPPPGGIQATATCTISAGAINAVTVTNQGAGYLTAPTIAVIASPYEAVLNPTAPGPTAPGVLTVNATLTGANTITAVICTNPGTAVTSVPTLTFTGGGGSSAAATAVMVFTATGFTVGTGTTSYGNAQPFAVLCVGGQITGSAGATINPDIGATWFTPRIGQITGISTSGGALTATSSVVVDGGLYPAVPTGIPIGQGTAGVVTVTVGGVTDTYKLTPV